MQWLPTIEFGFHQEKYSFLHIDDFFDQLVGAAVFSKIYLWSMYHQLKVKNEDVLQRFEHDIGIMNSL